MVLNPPYDWEGAETEGGECENKNYRFLFRKSQAINEITNDSEFPDLEKFQLYESEWELLGNYKEILEVYELGAENKC